jgi:hypothetical protein
LYAEEGIKPNPYNQAHWNLQADQEIMAWVTQQPGDWQIGGNCQAFLWGSGKHGQLAEAGNIKSFYTKAKLKQVVSFATCLKIKNVG